MRAFAHPIAGAGRHVGGLLLEVVLLIGIAATVIIGMVTLGGSRPPAPAGVGAASSAVWVVELTGARTSGALQRGDDFTVGYSTKARQPWAEAKCFPNETTVHSGTYSDGSIYGETFSVYAGGPTPQDFVLGVSLRGYWTGGGADCRVELITIDAKGLRKSLLATTRFVAGS
jgi:hypothetical protein